MEFDFEFLFNKYSSLCEGYREIAKCICDFIKETNTSCAVEEYKQSYIDSICYRQIFLVNSGIIYDREINLVNGLQILIAEVGIFGVSLPTYKIKYKDA